MPSAETKWQLSIPWYQWELKSPMGHRLPIVPEVLSTPMVDSFLHEKIRDKKKRTAVSGVLRFQFLPITPDKSAAGVEIK